MNKKDYETLLNVKNKEIENLKYQLENFESIQRGKCCECERDVIQKYSEKYILIMDLMELLNCEENEIIDKVKNLIK